MSQTERKGPFHIERNGQFVMIRSHHTFSARLSVSLPTHREGIMHVLPALALSEGMMLVLSSVGQDDVVIDGGGDAA